MMSRNGQFIRKGKRKRRRQQDPTLREKLTGLAILIISGIYVLFLWRTQTFLDTLDSKGRFRITVPFGSELVFAKAGSPETQDESDNIPPVGRHSNMDQKFIVFRGIVDGQGEGNAMAGLLAAHLLGLEFNRTVCVADSWKSFHQAFLPFHPDIIEHCKNVLLEWNGKRRNMSTIGLINFRGPANECRLQLAFNSTEPIVVLVANTYPRWPTVPDNFFFTYYRAKPALLKMLSYDLSHPPHMVVHLRAPDDVDMDPRTGLSDDALRVLRQLVLLRVPSHGETFLVTNRVEWFDMFQEWQHAPWQEVVHSAFKKSWGVRGQHFNRDNGAFIETQLPYNANKQTMQLWADWYTLLTAKLIYHTHSDFSISAIHWQNIDSKTIGNYDPETRNLELLEESWRIDGETARLVDRARVAEGTRELQGCSGDDSVQDLTIDQDDLDDALLT
jgi:hypothetical protein